jgi:hypothetical protein
VKPFRVLCLASLALGGLVGAGAEDELAGAGRTPPRLAWTEGAPSFFRAGAEGWAPAPVNLPLAPGDRLQTGTGGALELQLGPRDFLRAGPQTELALERHEADSLALRVGAGRASLDLRGLPAGQTLEVATPHAVVAIAAIGDYRVDVGADSTALTVRRDGRATLAAPASAPLAVGPNEQVVVRGDRVDVYAAPEPDDWDRWSLARTDEELGAISTHYAGEVYGACDLDRHGDWHTLAPYGSIWIPRVHVDWSPYALGRWLWDPYFGWSWLDDAPWGWAPFHHGRWIFVQGRWAWAPGPLGPRRIYAPALVAFYGSHRTTVLWVPLGWGEPIRPWWGPRRWIGQPHWLGWSGPRISAGTYANARLAGGAIAVPGEAFGRSPVAPARIYGASPRGLHLVRGALPVVRTPASYLGAAEPRARLVEPRARVPSRTVVSPTPMRVTPAPLAPGPRLAPPQRSLPARPGAGGLRGPTGIR